MSHKVASQKVSCFTGLKNVYNVDVEETLKIISVSFPFSQMSKLGFGEVKAHSQGCTRPWFRGSQSKALSFHSTHRPGM